MLKPETSNLVKRRRELSPIHVHVQTNGSRGFNDRRKMELIRSEISSKHKGVDTAWPLINSTPATATKHKHQEI